jgi:hypothetical protein
MSKAASAIARITREISQAQKNQDLSIAVACRDSDVRHLRALIIGSFDVLRAVTGQGRWLTCFLGPCDTPYEFGFFEFDLHVRHERSSCTWVHGEYQLIYDLHSSRGTILFAPPRSDASPQTAAALVSIPTSTPKEKCVFQS